MTLTIKDLLNVEVKFSYHYKHAFTFRGESNGSPVELIISQDTYKFEVNAEPTTILKIIEPHCEPEDLEVEIQGDGVIQIREVFRECVS